MHGLIKRLDAMSYDSLFTEACFALSQWQIEFVAETIDII